MVKDTRNQCKRAGKRSKRQDGGSERVKSVRVSRWADYEWECVQKIPESIISECASWLAESPSEAVENADDGTAAWMGAFAGIVASSSAGRPRQDARGVHQSRPC